MPQPKPTRAKKPPEPGKSIDERLAAFRRLMGSTAANLDESKKWYDRTAKAARLEMDTTKTAMDQLKSKDPFDKDDLAKYEELARHYKDLEQTEIVASEMMDRIYTASEGDEYNADVRGGNPTDRKPGSGLPKGRDRTANDPKRGRNAIYSLPADRRGVPPAPRGRSGGDSGS